MKSLLYSAFFLSVTCSAASNNWESSFSHLRYLNTYHSIGFFGAQEGIFRRYGSPFDCLPKHSIIHKSGPWKLYAPGLSFLARLHAFEVMAQVDETRREAFINAITMISSTDQDNKNLRTENSVLYAQLQALTAPSDQEEFVTPSTSPCGSPMPYKHIPKTLNLLVAVIALMYSFCSWLI